MDMVKIRNTTRLPQQASLRHEHDGVAGRTLYFRPHGKVIAPASVTMEPDVQAYANSGVLELEPFKGESNDTESKDKTKRKRKAGKE